jgi:hypothetical protein
MRASKPRETLTHTIDLNKLYVLKPGKYTLQVERFGGDRKPPVRSNTITVTVTS